MVRLLAPLDSSSNASMTFLKSRSFATRVLIGPERSAWPQMIAESEVTSPAATPRLNPSPACATAGSASTPRAPTRNASVRERRMPGRRLTERAAQVERQPERLGIARKGERAIDGLGRVARALDR